MPIPDSLQQKMELFRARGRVAEYHQGLFLEPSWLAVYLGQRIMPESWDARADLPPESDLRKLLQQTRQKVADTAGSMQDHAAFLQEYCPA